MPIFRVEHATKCAALPRFALWSKSCLDLPFLARTASFCSFAEPVEWLTGHGSTHIPETALCSYRRRRLFLDGVGLGIYQERPIATRIRDGGLDLVDCYVRRGFPVDQVAAAVCRGRPEEADCQGRYGRCPRPRSVPQEHSQHEEADRDVRGFPRIRAADNARRTTVATNCRCSFRCFHPGRVHVLSNTVAKEAQRAFPRSSKRALRQIDQLIA
jgi:hypothetical protein